MKKVYLDNLPLGGKYFKKDSINWVKSIGYKVPFIYDDIKGQIEIIDYAKYLGKNKLNIKFNNITYLIGTSEFRMCKLGVMLGKKSYEYKYNVGDIIEDLHSGRLEILEKIRIRATRGYKYKCLICGNEDKAEEGHLSNGGGCNVCSNRKVRIGINDMWTTNSKLAKLLLNPQDGYNHTQSSHSYVDWKCPNCGDVINNKKINSIFYIGLSCPQCSDGKSYPNKFIYNALTQLNINITTEKTFEWSKDIKNDNINLCGNKIYDFYIPSLNGIIEANGGQHYGVAGWHRIARGKTIIEERQNDKIKEQLAKKNAIKYYMYIDCRESKLEFIRDSMLKSELSKLYDLSNIDWIECHRYACSSLVKTACDLWNNDVGVSDIGVKLEINRGTVSLYLKQGTEANFCNYDTTTQQISRHEECRRSVICITTGEIFNSQVEAGEKYNMKNGGHISECCTGQMKSCGKHLVTNQPLVWMYYEDYSIASKEDIINKLGSVRTFKVINLDTEEIFETVKDASSKYNIDRSSIGKVCRGKKKTCGGYRWMYYDDYLKLHDEPISKIEL